MNLRPVLLLILTFVSAGTLNAQTDFRLGIKGGLNISKFHSKDVTHDYTAAGYHAGVFARIPLTDHLSIQPEAIYSIKGSRVRELFGDYITKADIRLSYIDAVGMLNLRFAQIINLQGGLVLGVLTDSRIENQSENPESLNLEETVEQQDFRLIDPAYAVGVEVDISRLSAGFRYTRGLRNVGDEINFAGQTIEFPELRNSVYHVYIALRIL
jgi:hypothetical protein